MRGILRFVFFDVLLAVRLSIFISVINQLDAVSCASQPVYETCTRRARDVHETATYRCDDTRGCVMQF